MSVDFVEDGKNRIRIEALHLALRHATDVSQREQGPDHIVDAASKFAEVSAS